MPKRVKDRLYFEVSRERSYGKVQVLTAGGAAGTSIGIMIATLVGAYQGLSLDSLVLGFLAGGMAGFAAGLIVTYLVVRYMDLGVPFSSRPSRDHGKTSSANEPEPETPVITPDEDAKGKTVDFVFPELSLDK